MYRSMFDCAKYVYRKEGLSAFYVSYPTTLSMTVPFTALQFLAYESISTHLNPVKKYDPTTHCLAGAVAGGFAAALTTPMDVIKTMLQTRGSAADAELRTVNGFVAGCRLLYQREGARGFFKGVKPRVLTTMPSTAICWSAYEASKYVFRKRSRTRDEMLTMPFLQGLLHPPKQLDSIMNNRLKCEGLIQSRYASKQIFAHYHAGHRRSQTPSVSTARIG
jgi:solute carrier family 25 iron transporter 28/37